MSRSWTAYLTGAAFALSAVAGGIAHAQTALADAQRDAEHDAARSEHVERIERAERPERGDRTERVERRVVIRDGGAHHMDQAEHLRTMLQLKASQEPALTAYLAAVRPEHRHEQIVEMSDHGDAKTTTQRLADMEARLAEQAAQGHARIEATRKFYNQLEPSQKKVFDELPMLMIGPMGPMMNMGPMKVMVNMRGMPPLPPMAPGAPRAPIPPPAPRS
jgi:LTXXQ motif family protein